MRRPVALAALILLLLAAGGGQAANGNDLAFPIRAAFYYPWYAGNWFDKAGCNLATPWTCASIHMPSEGYYAQSYGKARRDIDLMQRGKIRVGISSWFGPSHRTDVAVPDLLRAAVDDGQGFQWALYYELEGSPGSEPAVAKIRSDLDYIRSRYANHENYLWLNGKPVIFVYKNGGDCEDITRWAQATNNFASWYVNPSVHGDNGGRQAGYRQCSPQPSSWHQYAAEPAGDRQPGYSFTIGPEVWYWFAPSAKMPRDLARWRSNVAAMVASKEPWQLVLSWNEWGESTSVEPGTHRATRQSWGTAYLDALAGTTPACT